jgi:UDP-N-acetylmuramoyl-L-alanyl-D-glutamate--2,6-diaminopimelate ligase
MTVERIIDILQPMMVSGKCTKPVGKLHDDSRLVQPGDAFIAVRGYNSDGHQYIRQALANGASVIICEQPLDTEKACVLVVGDTRSVIGTLALEFQGNPHKRMKLVGVTGTNGKTTVSTLIWQALQKLGARPALSGTVQKALGTVRSSSNLTTPGPVELATDLNEAAEMGCTHFVMEVSSHALDQKRTDGLDFDVAVFTNLSHDHLDYHQDMQSYAYAKKRLFQTLKPETYAIVNSDDPAGSFMADDCKATVWDLTFKNADYRILQNDTEGLLIDLDGIYISSPLHGVFNAYNVAQAWLACVALGYAARDVASVLSECYGAAGRLENITTLLDEAPANAPLVFVDYAHTPDALENTLQTLVQIKSEAGRIHTVFGCGGDRDRTKRPEMARIAAKYSDLVTVTSDNPRNESPEAIIDDIFEGFDGYSNANRITDRPKAIAHAVGAALSGTIVLVAGKGHENYQEVKGVRHPMDDRELCVNALRTRPDFRDTKEAN